MRLCRNGITRTVLLIGPWAIKVPTVRYGWHKFLLGLLSNMGEKTFSCVADRMHLCPTIFSTPGGWLNVQRRCMPLTDVEWADVELCGDENSEYGCSKWFGFDSDFKRENFGTLNGQVVLLDYGELT